MRDYLPFIFVGITAGSLYGVAGMGLVLTYKTSGIFNFAHGAIAAAAAFLFFELHIRHHVPWPIAGVLSVALVGVVVGIAVERFARQLADARPVLSLAGMVGLLLLIQGLLDLRYGFVARPFPDFLPSGGVSVSGVLFTWQQLFSVCTATAAAVALYAFFRYSATGSALRAAVDDPELLDLSGTSPVRVRRLSWMIGCAFAAITGILIAPSLGLGAAILTLLVVQAFGAVAVGRFSSLPATYLGGIGIGVGASLLTKIFANSPSVGGVAPSLPFLVLFGVLLVAPPPRDTRAMTRVSAPRRGAASTRQVVALAVICVAVAGLVPQFAGPKLLLFTNAAVLVPMFLSLAMLVRLSGQLSLCHAAFVAIGASTMGHLAGSAGVPWFLALLLAGLAVVPIGAIVAMPAIRLSGVYLALATFGFGILVEQLLFGQAVMFGAIGLRHAPRPTIARSDDAYYLLVLAIAVATCLLVYAVTKSRLGRLLRALGDSAVVLRVSGVDTNSTRVMVFCLSAFLAGITGALTIAALGQAGGRTFGYVNSLLWLTVLVVSGPKVVSGAVAAALGLAVVPSYFPQSLLPHLPVVFGAIAIAVTALDGATVKGRIPALDRARRSPVRARLSLPAPIGAPRRTSA